MPIKVNDEYISEQAVEYELGRLVRFFSGHMSANQIRNQMELLKQKARNQAVGAKLLISEADRLGLEVSPDRVDAKFNEMMKNAGGEEAFNKLLKTQNITADIVRQTIVRGHRVDKLIEKITEGVSDPTEKEIKAHFESHREEYRKPDRAQAQHILMNFSSKDRKDREIVKSKLLEIKKRIEEGADFADMAASYSDCPSGKNAGGSLGWITRGMMVPEFDEVLFSMKAGELSDVIETVLGCHIVRKTANEEGGEASYEEVREKIREFLRHSARGEVIAEYVKELREKAVIEGE